MHKQSSSPLVQRITSGLVDHWGRRRNLIAKESEAGSPVLGNDFERCKFFKGTDGQSKEVKMSGATSSVLQTVVKSGNAAAVLKAWKLYRTLKWESFSHVSTAILP